MPPADGNRKPSPWASNNNDGNNDADNCCTRGSKEIVADYSSFNSNVDSNIDSEQKKPPFQQANNPQSSFTHLLDSNTKPSATITTSSEPITNKQHQQQQDTTDTACYNGSSISNISSSTTLPQSCAATATITTTNLSKTKNSYNQQHHCNLNEQVQDTAQQEDEDRKMPPLNNPITYTTSNGSDTSYPTARAVCADENYTGISSVSYSSNNNNSNNDDDYAAVATAVAVGSSDEPYTAAAHASSYTSTAASVPFAATAVAVEEVAPAEFAQCEIDQSQTGYDQEMLQYKLMAAYGNTAESYATAAVVASENRDGVYTSADASSSVEDIIADDGSNYANASTHAMACQAEAVNESYTSLPPPSPIGFAGHEHDVSEVSGSAMSSAMASYNGDNMSSSIVGNTPLFAAALVDTDAEVAVLRSQDSIDGSVEEARIQDMATTEMKRMAFAGVHLQRNEDGLRECSQGDESYSSLMIRDGEAIADAEACVISISNEAIHPSTSFEDNAAQAEFMGEDSTRSVSSIPDTLLAQPHPAFANAYTDVSASVGEVVVSVENEVSNTGAVVLEQSTATIIEDSADVYEDKKPAAAIVLPVGAMVEPYYSASQETTVLPSEAITPIARYEDEAEVISSEVLAESFAVAGQEAEVLSIHEEVHPCEAPVSAATAELIGNDYTATIGVATSSTQDLQSDYHLGVPAAAVASTVQDEGIREATVVQTVVVERRAEFEEPQKPQPLANIAVVVQPDVSDEVADNSHASNNTNNNNNSHPSEEDDIVPEWMQDTPAPMRFADRAHTTETSQGATSSISSGGSIHQISTSIARGTNNVMEALFGDKQAFVCRRHTLTENEVGMTIRPRTLLPWSVIYSETTNMWVTTLQTNQKALDSHNVAEAQKSLRAFSLPTEQQAICLARAWTPPRMSPRTETACHICRMKFAVFRRSCHCRNCGVCICKQDCAVNWPCRMVPETYNIKKENYVRVCKACDWLSTSFRTALLEGNRDKAVALHAAGNLNLTCPFANVKGEEFYPVHCAVLGRNIHLLNWLVEENCCPIKSVRVSGKTKDVSGKYTAIVTSKGRSLLGIALENRDVEIIRYLVVDKGLSLYGESDITPFMLLQTLDKILRLLPQDMSQLFNPAMYASGQLEQHASFSNHPPEVAPESFNTRTLSEEARDFGAIDFAHSHAFIEDFDMRGFEASRRDECIICCDGSIDCVATPCGHQICCLKCSKNISKCPVCSADCTFMKVFKRFMI